MPCVLPTRGQKPAWQGLCRPPLESTCTAVQPKWSRWTSLHAFILGETPFSYCSWNITNWPRWSKLHATIIYCYPSLWNLDYQHYLWSAVPTHKLILTLPFFLKNLLGFIQRIVGSDMAELLMRNSQGQYGSGGSEGSEAPTLIGRGHHTTRTEEDVLCLLDI